MSTPEIVVVDYHKGNLLSVARSLSSVGARVAVSDDPEAIAGAEGIVMPGVGSFEDAMAYLNESGQAEAVVQAVRAGTPYLGICLGMQVLLGRGSEHSDATAWEEPWIPGLGVLAGSVTRLEGGRLKVPHVGWDQLHLTPHGRDCALYAGVPEGANVYFTHSYALADDVDDAVVTTRSHYTRSFASGVWQQNVYGVQFHPEKSSATGLAILRNFVQLV